MIRDKDKVLNGVVCEEGRVALYMKEDICWLWIFILGMLYTSRFQH